MKKNKMFIIIALCILICFSIVAIFQLKTDINELKEEANKRFSPNEIFIKDNKLIALGNEFNYQERKTVLESISYIDEIFEETNWE